MIRLRATIYVSHESQKGIVIGHKGAAIKKVGIKAHPHPHPHPHPQPHPHAHAHAHAHPPPHPHTTCGASIKKMGIKARAKLEDFFQTKVYLETRVKVRPNWRQDEGSLREWGYLM